MDSQEEVKYLRKWLAIKEATIARLMEVIYNRAQREVPKPLTADTGEEKGT